MTRPSHGAEDPSFVCGLEVNQRQSQEFQLVVGEGES